MAVLSPRCGGLDIPPKTGGACLMTSAAGQPPAQTTRTCGTMTTDLLAVADG